MAIQLRNYELGKFKNSTLSLNYEFSPPVHKLKKSSLPFLPKHVSVTYKKVPVSDDLESQSNFELARDYSQLKTQLVLETQ